ncbi:MAG: hypothetical protein KA313_09485 [Pseudarcicella sp.]|nr:hypothetical protein [Pseudarcicella sp.]MBP6411319.1 hypothetical protein [Pseudarcicella sp.]
MKKLLILASVFAFTISLSLANINDKGKKKGHCDKDKKENCDKDKKECCSKGSKKHGSKDIKTTPAN